MFLFLIPVWKQEKNRVRVWEPAREYCVNNVFYTWHLKMLCSINPYQSVINMITDSFQYTEHLISGAQVFQFSESCYLMLQIDTASLLRSRLLHFVSFWCTFLSLFSWFASVWGLFESFLYFQSFSVLLWIHLIFFPLLTSRMKYKLHIQGLWIQTQDLCSLGLTVYYACFKPNFCTSHFW